MTELLLATQAVPSTQPLSLMQFVIGLVTVILSVAGIAWKAGRAVATKDDLKTLKDENEKAHAAITENVMENRKRIDAVTENVMENRKRIDAVTENVMENRKRIDAVTENVMENRKRIDAVTESVHSIDRNLMFLSGRQHERDQSGSTNS